MADLREIDAHVQRGTRGERLHQRVLCGVDSAAKPLSVSPDTCGTAPVKELVEALRDLNPQLWVHPEARHSPGPAPYQAGASLAGNDSIDASVTTSRRPSGPMLSPGAMFHCPTRHLARAPRLRLWPSRGSGRIRAITPSPRRNPPTPKPNANAKARPLMGTSIGTVRAR